MFKNLISLCHIIDYTNCLRQKKVILNKKLSESLNYYGPATIPYIIIIILYYIIIFVIVKC